MNITALRTPTDREADQLTSVREVLNSGLPRTTPASVQSGP